MTNKKRLYNEVQAVEVALRNQMVEAIDEEYLTPLQNPTTNMINNSIRYLHISDQQLRTISPGTTKGAGNSDRQLSL